MIDYNGQRLCGVDDRLGIGEFNCRWPRLDVTWSITEKLPAFDMESFIQAMDLAWSLWTNVCGIRPVRIDGPANLNIGIMSGTPGGVLADCEMPCSLSMEAKLRMRLDTSEAWTKSENPASNRVDVIRVIAHELGHGIGIPHIGMGNLMAPTYSTTIRKPQSGDRNEAVARYGLPGPIPEPTPTEPLPPGVRKELLAFFMEGGKLIIRADGKTFGAE